jgi:ABC-type branched-subunit amino acid transport system substrate-binding protein
MKTIQHIRNALLSTAVALLATGVVQAGPAADASSAIAKAEAARQQAVAVGGEWRDTGKMIKQAKAAAKKGDFAAAQRLANRALHEGELGYQQALQQKNADFPAYLQ